MSNHPLGAVCATRTDPFRVLEEIKRLTLERLGGLPGTLYGPIEDALALSALHVDRDAFQYEDQAALWSLRHQQAAQVMRFRQQLAKGFDEFRTLRAPGRNYLTMGLLDESQLDLHIAGERMAEALAECMHARVRTDLWGYAAGEALSNEDLIKEKYQGIRPAPGYPACPDHSLKPILFDLLDAPTNTGLTLTESFAMWPTAAVSGFYFGHPEAAYFGVARVGPDQVEEYAQRRGVDLATAERWLRPNLD